MSPQAGPAVMKLYTPDTNGRVYCGQGSATDDFEQEFGKATGLNRAPLGVNSCSVAIDLALHMIGVGNGDEIICSPLTCTASNGSVVTRGARIIWADIDSVTGNMLPESVKRVITPRTKAVIAVDWAGRSCDYAALREAAAIPGTRTRAHIIEDAAHKLYTPEIHGDYVAYSFGPIKHLTTGGYGGALLAPMLSRKRAELLRWHGLDRTTGAADFRCEQDIKEIGFRAHMTDDQAVVGMANLSLAMDSVDVARHNAAIYYEALKNLPGITVPPFDPYCDYWLFGLIINEDRDGFMAYMAEQSVPTSRVHARNDKHTAFRAASANLDTPLPGCDYFDAHQVNIPTGWWLSQGDIDRVIQAVSAWAASRSGDTLVASGKASES